MPISRCEDGLKQLLKEAGAGDCTRRVGAIQDSSRQPFGPHGPAVSGPWATSWRLLIQEVYPLFLRSPQATDSAAGHLAGQGTLLHFRDVAGLG